LEKDTHLNKNGNGNNNNQNQNNNQNLLCNGVDPHRASYDSKSLGTATDVAACKSKSVAAGSKVFAYDADNKDCWGYSKFSGSCEANLHWKMYLAEDESVTDYK